jgi:hypothetical protein
MGKHNGDVVEACFLKANDKVLEKLPGVVTASI